MVCSSDIWHAGNAAENGGLVASVMKARYQHQMKSESMKHLAEW